MIPSTKTFNLMSRTVKIEAINVKTKIPYSDDVITINMNQHEVNKYQPHYRLICGYFHKNFKSLVNNSLSNKQRQLTLKQRR